MLNATHYIFELYFNLHMILDSRILHGRKEEVINLHKSMNKAK